MDQGNNLATSNYEVLNYYVGVVPDPQGGTRRYNFTEMKVTLVTGKTHQIRVHMKLLSQALQLE